MNPSRHSFFRQFIVIVAGFALIASLAACEETTETEEDFEEDTLHAEEDLTGMTDETLIDIIMSDDRFTQLTTAIDSADYISTLREDGPYTIFAPTNDAFEALPEGTFDELLQNTDRLQEILSYHLVDEQNTVANLEDGDTLDSMEGSSIQIFVENGTVMVNESTVIEADIQARNGVLHVIDAVLLPPES